MAQPQFFLWRPFFLCGVVMVCVYVCVVGREGNYPHNITPHLLSLLRAKNFLQRNHKKKCSFLHSIAKSPGDFFIKLFMQKPARPP